MSISGNRKVGDFSIFDTTDATAWEEMYSSIMDKKYSKHSRNFSTSVRGTKWVGRGQPPIYLIPRERGGPSYKQVSLVGCNPTHLLYAPISKGYPMQGVSSFSLGPIIGHGLCLVNSAFSKPICVKHIEGGGICDLSRKNFWKPSKSPYRKIYVLNETHMLVDDEFVEIDAWLQINKDLWYAEWDAWRKSIALCSLGDFHWTDDSEVVAYWLDEKTVDFVKWKKECYIRPSYELLPSTKEYKFLEKMLTVEKIPLGLVHPKAITGHAELPVTAELIRRIYDSKDEMCCQPFVVAGKLLNVPIDL